MSLVQFASQGWGFGPNPQQLLALHAVEALVPPREDPQKSSPLWLRVSGRRSGKTSTVRAIAAWYVSRWLREWPFGRRLSTDLFLVYPTSFQAAGEMGAVDRMVGYHWITRTRESHCYKFQAKGFSVRVQAAFWRGIRGGAQGAMMLADEPASTTPREEILEFGRSGVEQAIFVGEGWNLW